MNRTIQGLWIGDALSTMERLSIASFLAHGHEFELYTYGPLRGVPEGTRLRDAAEILAADRVFRYRAVPSVAGFANDFRYKLLLERGGWWVDLDSVCLGPFDFDEEFVFAAEAGRSGEQVPTNGFLKAPAGSAVMRELWQRCQAKDPSRITWGETGPRLLRDVLPLFGLEASVRPSHVFCPLDYHDWERVLDPDATWSFPDSTRAIHLWNEMWRGAGRAKDAVYHPACLYERLKARYGVGP
jgi:mannosyltransferase OCH1-like enzyme